MYTYEYVSLLTAQKSPPPSSSSSSKVLDPHLSSPDRKQYPRRSRGRRSGRQCMSRRVDRHILSRPPPGKTPIYNDKLRYIHVKNWLGLEAPSGVAFTLASQYDINISMAVAFDYKARLRSSTMRLHRPVNVETLPGHEETTGGWCSITPRCVLGRK